MSDEPVVTYVAESQVRDIRVVLREMFLGGWRGRHLMVRLFRRDLRAEFSDAALGYLWNFADPIVLAIVFVFLRGGGAISVEGIDMPYPVYVVYGMLLLQVFLQALNRPLALLTRYKDLISQVRIPPEALLGSQVLRLGFDSCFYVPIMLCVGLGLGAFDVAGMLLFVLLYPTMILLGFACSVLLIPVSAIYSDFKKFTQMLNRPLLFLCPTFYYVDPSSALGMVNTYNPIAILMNNLRMLAVDGHLSDPIGMIVTVIGLVILLVFGWFVFHVSIPVVASRL